LPQPNPPNVLASDRTLEGSLPDLLPTAAWEG
jgi:hypothetical protein